MKLKKISVFSIVVVYITVTLIACIAVCINYIGSFYCGADGNKHNVKWKLDDGTLTISGTGEMFSYGKFEK